MREETPYGRKLTPAEMFTTEEILDALSDPSHFEFGDPRLHWLREYIGLLEDATAWAWAAIRWEPTAPLTMPWRSRSVDSINRLAKSLQKIDFFLERGYIDDK